ncbi:unnamed protein product [Rotaria socialis]|uniref:Uncharacterized protein n=1 Tax=Rotaria socialis TaxID=392032 RepID=A0A821Y0M4_9BILA|nr:unnamed protein product [Rotaria socialis]
MTTQSASYDDIHEGKPRITSYDDNGVRTTTTTTKLGPDPKEKPKDIVTVRKIQHPDSIETVTITEKKLPPIRYTETITREKLPKQSTPSHTQVAQPALLNVPTSGGLRPTSIPPTPAEKYITHEIPPTATTYNVVRPPIVSYFPTRQERVIVTQPERLTGPPVVLRSTPEPTSYVPVQNSRTTRFVEDRHTLVNYPDDYYGTRRTGQRSHWCGNCGGDCFSCNCFDDCCGTTSCCRTNSFARRKDVVSYKTRVTRDGRRVRYRVS